MTYTHEPAGPKNLLVLDEDGAAVASVFQSRVLVSLQDISLVKLATLWTDFKVELRTALRDVLGMTPGEFKEWHLYNDKYRANESVLSANSCLGFKKPSMGVAKLSYMRQAPIIQALIDLSLVPATDPHRVRRKKMVRGQGGVSAFCQSLPIAQQRLILAEVFANEQASLDDIVVLGQTGLIGAEEIDHVLATAPDARSVLQWLAEILWSFDVEQKNQTLGGRGAGRRYAAPWFCGYLAREGYILLPYLQGSQDFLPRLLTPFLWTFFVREAARKLSVYLVRNVGSSSWPYAYAALRDLVLRTNFFRQDLGSVTLDHMLRLKREYTTAEDVTDSSNVGQHRGHGINQLFNCYLKFHGRTWEDIGADARYFGGGKKLTSGRGREAFGWVENPRGHKLSLYREIVGEPPDEFPEVIVSWARDLRSLLPLFGVQDPESKIFALNFWLIYLTELGDKTPNSWWEIDRETHINNADENAHLTFIGFVRKLDLANPQNIISTLQKAWHLAAVRDGVVSKLTCPIDFRSDHVGWTDSRNIGRTRRKSIPQDIHRIILEEHRRENFAFARSLTITDGPRQGTRIHWRTVVDPLSNQRTELFWPGVPMILDVILAMGTRFSSARWLDSGEGDDYVVDPATLTLTENPLPSRTKNRAESFLQAHQIGPRETDKVLGMHLAVNKTGPYSVPWVDQATARAFQEMRLWQIQFNPRKSPVRASNSDIQIQYAGEGKIPEVYPIFRDPESRTSFPPTTGAIYNYWGALLGHCEKVVEQKLGHHEPLLVEGKPRWDLHSLRVTTVSTLLEAGIEPWIVSELVGHSSVMMTWHYKDVDPRKTHLALQRA